MIDRVFLGWEKPVTIAAAEWLQAHCKEPAATLVVVPTGHSGRLLAARISQAGGKVPRFTTPGTLFREATPGCAPVWVETAAWEESLESIRDWQPYAELFAEPPMTDGNWASGLANDLIALRHALQENGLTIAIAASRMSESVEAARWQALAMLEKRTEAKLREWGQTSRSMALANGAMDCALAEISCSRIVLVGVTEMPPLLARSLATGKQPVTVLVAAPPEEKQGFNELGLPNEPWSVRHIAWPAAGRGSVELVSDPREQARAAVRVLAHRGTAPAGAAIASACEETTTALARELASAGWLAHVPGSRMPRTGLGRWLRVWSSWLDTPDLATLNALLSLPATAVLLADISLHDAARAVGTIRSTWVVSDSRDVAHRVRHDTTLRDKDAGIARLALKVAGRLEQARNAFLRDDFPPALATLISRIAPDDPQLAEAMAWLQATEPFFHRTRRSHASWLELLLRHLPSLEAEPPRERATDILGWLELFFETGPHIVLCGLNEGLLPARSAADPWLPEAALRTLGLRGESARVARDNYLLTAILASRQKDGFCDLFCAKTSLSGDTLLPSRLLLATDPQTLPASVATLFRELPPADSAISWERDAPWRVPAPVEMKATLYATALGDWLACPFRYHLKHNLRMSPVEPMKLEWDARDFGNAIHEVLEIWGRDSEARDFSKAEALEEWLSQQLDLLVARHFADTPPLAVRLQAASLRQRLAWFAHDQAIMRAEGWQVAEVEQLVELPFGTTTVRARIDRIDRHRDTGALRVIDYKTSNTAQIITSHRKPVGRTDLPAHLGQDTPAFQEIVAKGKSVIARWINLQVPLYASAVHRDHGILPTPCYMQLGKTRDKVTLQQWEAFSEADLTSATECAAWVISRIREGIFWPPAERVEYDDFSPLAAGHPLKEMFELASP